jgi:hypothetical protein
VRLLVGDADQLSYLLLGQAEADSARAHASPDVAIDILCPGGLSRMARRATIQLKVASPGGAEQLPG